jgi:SAM-dependent methyltransferase
MTVGNLSVCPACGSSVEVFRPGPDGRPGRSCPTCRGLERHRFLALLIEAIAPQTLRQGALLDVAPSATMTPRLRELAGERYIAIDFDPAADRRVVDVRASLTQLPLPDDSVDLMVCYHVLEHIPDDATAMEEIARVVRPGGMAIVQVPFRPGPTDEDPSAPVEERIRRFGQADHVRYYGDDFDTRMEKAGLEIQRVRPVDVVPPEMVDLFRLPAHDLVWLCHPRGAEAPMTVQDMAGGWGGVLPLVLRRALAASERERRTLTEALERQRAATERWRRTYRQLRGRLPVRVMLRAARAARAGARMASTARKTTRP